MSHRGLDLKCCVFKVAVGRSFSKSCLDSNTFSLIDQKHYDASYLCKLIPNDFRIDWKKNSREIFNLYEADNVNCDIITLTDDLIAKRKFFRKSLKDYSTETSKKFFEDAKKIKFKF